MKTKKTRTDAILTTMNVLVWIAFIALMVKAGAFLVSYAISYGVPEGSKNVQNGLNLYNLRLYSFEHYTTMVAFMAAIPAMQAYTAYLMIKVLSKIKLSNPFTMEVANSLEKVSQFILGTWVVAMLYNIHASWLMKRVDGLQVNLIPGEFIFLAGVVFVIAQIFKKGVEIQSENELTV